ncbi:tyrosine-type recombinase/integrase [Porticoccaceae bacterium]|nr:tyrosine-type recombinase/integrase [Porticoccaceae bacterium]MDB2343234.1 tyrosine-type recombinase/integrase [Porticoccaceae bacterium]MDB2634666.1 tyrosine-type recombinase/integrase [Porticoccaceae bacterium]
MSKRVTKLELDQIIKVGKPKRYPLGDGLYFTITKQGSMSFGIRYQVHGKTDYKGMGAFHKVNNTLGMARAKCEAYRVKIKQGINPKVEEQQELAFKQAEARMVEERTSSTFKNIALELINDRKSEWAPKTLQAWENTLATYAFPIIGNMPVADIDKTHIAKILKPIWLSKPDMAKKLRWRMEAVFSRAIFYDLRPVNNPALYKDNLEVILPAQKVKVKSHAALPYADLPDFMDKLSKLDGFGARALEICILNATRTSETLKATWDEFDLEEGVWTIPAERMKMGAEHKIPLSEHSIKLVRRMAETKICEFVFPNRNSLKHLSGSGMSSVLDRMGYKDVITVHGFRSTFRDYIAEETRYENIVAEMALAHGIDSKVERSYRRGDLLKRRKSMMELYSNYACATPQSNVVSITG